MKTRFILLTLAGFLFFSVLPARADHLKTWPFRSSPRPGLAAAPGGGFNLFRNLINFLINSTLQQPSTKEPDQKKTIEERLKAAQRPAQKEPGRLSEEVKSQAQPMPPRATGKGLAKMLGLPEGSQLINCIRRSSDPDNPLFNSLLCVIDDGQGNRPSVIIEIDPNNPKDQEFLAGLGEFRTKREEEKKRQEEEAVIKQNEKLAQRCDNILRFVIAGGKDPNDPNPSLEQRCQALTDQYNEQCADEEPLYDTSECDFVCNRCQQKLAAAQNVCAQAEKREEKLEALFCGLECNKITPTITIVC